MAGIMNVTISIVPRNCTNVCKILDVNVFLVFINPYKKCEGVSIRTIEYFILFKMSQLLCLVGCCYLFGYKITGICARRYSAKG